MTDSLTTVAPVVRELTVAAPIETCYRVFVEGFDQWWPREHHVGDRTVTEFRIEPFVGGRCYDTDTTGGVSRWGTVLALDPPNRFAFAWHVQGDWTIDLDPGRQSEVEVTFSAVDSTTTAVRLEHRHLERHGAGAIALQAGVGGEGGWTTSLGRFADVMEGRPPRPLPAA